MKKAIVLDRQSIFDVSIAALGGVEAAFDIALQNDLPITAQPNPGTELAFNTPVADAKVVNHYAVNNINPATGLESGGNPVPADGIFDHTFDSTFE
jgi:hypothetical protein